MQSRWLSLTAISAVGVALVVLLVAWVAPLGRDDRPPGGRPDRPEGPPRTTPNWPNAANTGVPPRTALTAYSGPCTLTAAAALAAVDASACDALVVQAGHVSIEDSRVPRIEVTSGGASSVTVTDSTVVGGTWEGGSVWGADLTLTRVDVSGGQHSVHCSSRCTVADSWLHDQYNPDGGSFHNNAFLTNGGSDIVVRGNTLACTGQVNQTDGGCTADLSLFGDFAPIRNVVVEDNLFRSTAGGYCGSFGHNPDKEFGRTPTGIVVRNNVFERGTGGACGIFGAVTSYLSTGRGNVWAGNTWDDREPLDP